MARGRSGTGKGLGALRDTGSETLQLVIDYVKQETLDPLRGLGRYIVFGVTGAVALSIGLVILSVAFLRFLKGAPSMPIPPPTSSPSPAAPSPATGRGRRT